MVTPTQTRKERFDIPFSAPARTRLGFVIPPGEESDPFYTEANLREVLKGMEDLEAGRNCHIHELVEPDD